MQYKWISFLVLMTLCLSLWMIPVRAEEPAATEEKPDAAALVEFGRSVMKQSGEIKLTGSALAKPLLDKLAEAYKAKNPEVTIDIQASDTLTAFKAVKAGEVTGGVSCREMYETEFKDYAELKSFSIAASGIAVIVNSNSPVTKLSMAQLKDIYNGKITKWKQVEGQDKPIILVFREDTADLRAMFDEIAGGGPLKIPAKGAITANTNEEVIQAVVSNPDAIGYIAFSASNPVVKALLINDAEPTIANVTANTYSIVYPINIITKDMPEELLRTWMLFMLGPEGQDIVGAEGYMRVD